MKIAIPNLRKRFGRNRTASDVEEELRFHLEMLECKYAQEGMSAVAAKAAARKRFGNLETVKQQCVQISTRSSGVRRILKTFSLFVLLAGLTIRILAANPQVAHIGDTLIMIAIAGRLLLYVRGLTPSSFRT